jgi:hypothetical protein
MTENEIRSIVREEIKNHQDEYAFKWWREDILKNVNLTLDEYLHDANLTQIKRDEADLALSEAKKTLGFRQGFG